jgi:hypothetical protein
MQAHVSDASAGRSPGAVGKIIHYGATITPAMVSGLTAIVNAIAVTLMRCAPTRGFDGELTEYPNANLPDNATLQTSHYQSQRKVSI